MEKINCPQDLNIYKESKTLANSLWKKINAWDYLSKSTVGNQLIRSSDSISANIAEGFGRYHKKDKIKFFFNARASIYESIDWIEKIKDRNLINRAECEKLVDKLTIILKQLNKLIKITNEKLKK